MHRRVQSEDDRASPLTSSPTHPDHPFLILRIKYATSFLTSISLDGLRSARVDSSDRQTSSDSFSHLPGRRKRPLHATHNVPSRRRISEGFLWFPAESRSVTCSCPVLSRTLSPRLSGLIEEVEPLIKEKEQAWIINYFRFLQTCGNNAAYGSNVNFNLTDVAAL